MRSLEEILLFAVVATDFAVLGTSRLTAGIRAIAFQGLALGLLPIVLHPSRSAHVLGLAAGTIAVKAIVLPWLLRRAIREASVRREVEPLIGYMASVLLGAAALAGAFVLARRLPLGERETTLLIPIAFATVVIGLLVLVTRSKALTQVVGYLMLENGIYLFGLTQVDRVPFLVEVGVLLDVFAGVFIMGIVVFHINREFDSLSAVNLSELRD
jgi:hydrogenase-4 component E